MLSSCLVPRSLSAGCFVPGSEPNDFKALTDARIGIVKVALQLTPEQEKLSPLVEEAIRARADARYQRMAAVAQRRSQEGEVDPAALLRDRSDASAAKQLRSKSSLMRGHGSREPQSRPEGADAPLRDACPSSIERR